MLLFQVYLILTLLCSVFVSLFAFFVISFLFLELYTILHCDHFPCIRPLLHVWLDEGWQTPINPLSSVMSSTCFTSPTVSIIEQSQQARHDLKTVPRRFQTGGKILWWSNNLLWMNACLATPVPWLELYTYRKKVGKSASVCTYVTMWAVILPPEIPFMFLVITFFCYLKVRWWSDVQWMNRILWG